MFKVIFEDWLNSNNLINFSQITFEKLNQEIFSSTKLLTKVNEFIFVKHKLH